MLDLISLQTSHRYNMAPAIPTQSGNDLLNQTVTAVLRILRGQRDDKQIQDLEDTYDFNPQIFQYGVHYVAGPIMFRNPYRNTPSITFGAIAQKIIENTTVADHPLAQGYTPLIIYPYVYGFAQSAGAINGFYLGLYAMTPIPPSATSYTIAWHASGRSSPYPDQRVDEAWTSSYNQNVATHLVNETGQVDTQ